VINLTPTSEMELALANCFARIRDLESIYIEISRQRDYLTLTLGSHRNTIRALASLVGAAPLAKERYGRIILALVSQLLDDLDCPYEALPFDDAVQAAAEAVRGLTHIRSGIGFLGILNKQRTTSPKEE
jgi:hypothetical protein